ncbi:sulfite exporter TauE/SafE family protein [Indioceanicola profundi]|uniref:sulfite exporter TauE/SafE family protein n=1 Tax=Indioceanicola profundi TaxID=2220096 RepID=UPI000E6AC6B0|nr:sulfite exporter TauE/SafE family protein [Indioceanicola profundi]
MHEHAHTAASTIDGLWPLITAMFMTGLAGGFGHCTSMCGPFVMAQVAGGIAGHQPVAAGAPVLVRAQGGLLLPYHLGRVTTYTVLGAIVAGLSGMVVAGTGFRWLLGAVLLIAAVLFLQRALKGFGRWLPALGRAADHRGMAFGARIGVGLARFLRPLLADPRGVNGYALGVALGFLPCGFLYAALASAVGTGSSLGGALVMGAFALGTAPSLITVGVLGSVAASRWTATMRVLAPVLMLFNAVVVGTMAWHAFA